MCIGFFGIECVRLCFFGYYGIKCLEKCLCDECNSINGVCFNVIGIGKNGILIGSGFGKMISILYCIWLDNEIFLGMNEVIIYRVENYLLDIFILVFYFF